MNELKGKNRHVVKKEKLLTCKVEISDVTEKLISKGWKIEEPKVTIEYGSFLYVKKVYQGHKFLVEMSTSCHTESTFYVCDYYDSIPEVNETKLRIDFDFGEGISFNVHFKDEIDFFCVCRIFENSQTSPFQENEQLMNLMKDPSRILSNDTVQNYITDEEIEEEEKAKNAAKKKRSVMDRILFFRNARNPGPRRFLDNTSSIKRLVDLRPAKWRMDQVIIWFQQIPCCHEGMLTSLYKYIITTIGSSMFSSLRNEFVGTSPFEKIRMLVMEDSNRSKYRKAPGIQMIVNDHEIKFRLQQHYRIMDYLGGQFNPSFYSVLRKRLKHAGKKSKSEEEKRHSLKFTSQDDRIITYEKIDLIINENDLMTKIDYFWNIEALYCRIAFKFLFGLSIEDYIEEMETKLQKRFDEKKSREDYIDILEEFNELNGFDIRKISPKTKIQYEAWKLERLITQQTPKLKNLHNIRKEIEEKISSKEKNPEELIIGFEEHQKETEKERRKLFRLEMRIEEKNKIIEEARAKTIEVQKNRKKIEAEESWKSHRINGSFYKEMRKIIQRKCIKNEIMKKRDIKVTVQCLIVPFEKLKTFGKSLKKTKEFVDVQTQDILDLEEKNEKEADLDEVDSMNFEQLVILNDMMFQWDSSFEGVQIDFGGDFIKNMEEYEHVTPVEFPDLILFSPKQFNTLVMKLCQFIIDRNTNYKNFRNHHSMMYLQGSQYFGSSLLVHLGFNDSKGNFYCSSRNDTCDYEMKIIQKLKVLLELEEISEDYVMERIRYLFCLNKCVLYHLGDTLSNEKIFSGVIQCLLDWVDNVSIEVVSLSDFEIRSNQLNPEKDEERMELHEFLKEAERMEVGEFFSDFASGIMNDFFKPSHVVNEIGDRFFDFFKGQTNYVDEESEGKKMDYKDFFDVPRTRSEIEKAKKAAISYVSSKSGYSRIISEKLSQILKTKEKMECEGESVDFDDHVILLENLLQSFKKKIEESIIFEEEKSLGSGTYYFGTIFFHGNHLHGYGFELSKKTSTMARSRYSRVFCGFYRNGLRDGEGEEYDEKRSLSDTKYLGGFLEDKKEGKGYGIETIDGEEVIYNGNYSKGSPHGNGETRNLVNGEIKFGKFENGKISHCETMFVSPEIDFKKLESYAASAKILGRGAFGTVYQIKTKLIKKLLKSKNFEVPDGEEYIAIKLLDQIENQQKGSEGGKRTLSIYSRMKLQSDIIRSVSLIGNLKDSEYILPILGRVTGRYCGYVMICGEYSVDSVVGSKNYPLDKKIQILKEIALGMRSLHRLKIMHRDLKAANIILKNGVVKIADIDSARQTEDWKYDLVSLTKAGIGTSCFVAPEVIKGKNYGIDIDVYSYGMIIYCLLYSTQNPLSSYLVCGVCGDQISAHNVTTHVSDCKLRPLLDQSKIEQVDPKCRFLLEIMQMCWEEQPEKRPSFDNIVNIFEDETCFTICNIRVKDTFNPKPEKKRKKRKKKKKRKKSEEEEEEIKPLYKIPRGVKVLLMGQDCKLLKKQIEEYCFPGSKVMEMSYQGSSILDDEEELKKCLKHDRNPTFEVILDKLPLSEEERRKISDQNRIKDLEEDVRITKEENRLLKKDVRLMKLMKLFLEKKELWKEFERMKGGLVEEQIQKEGVEKKTGKEDKKEEEEEECEGEGEDEEV